RVFSPVDLRAYGADSIGALLEALGPQVTSNRGRGDGTPVTLLNGRRISDFSEIARIPTEAIERMEVFPEELALQYGYRADQKVVNIVT
ncbi:TonB-dependent receptor plug domain-containing protein, partial [Acinetobacter baumannii]|nr:TonB-dependent receptor plug domain-containing protein [Acinetobacter baumannii]